MIILVQNRINADAIANMLITAFDNHSCIGHWADRFDQDDSGIPPRDAVPESVSDQPWYVKAALCGRLMIVVSDHPAKDGHETGMRFFWLNMDNIVKGLEMLAEKSPRHYANVLKNETDIDNADVFLQYALFGEYIYA